MVFVSDHIYAPPFIGDTGAGGKIGYVPAPAAGDAAAGKFLKADATWGTPGGGGFPGGANKSVQYNNAGAFGGAAAFEVNTATGNVNIPTGAAIEFSAVPSIIAQTALENFYDGGGGNFTGTGTHNFGTGAGVLTNLTNGTDNCGIGHNALNGTLGGYQNAAMGSGALTSNTTGHDNFGFGFAALNSCVTGSSNVAIGSQTMQLVVTPQQSIAIGTQALSNASSASNIVAIGRISGIVNTSGADWVGVGSSALSGNTSGGQNVAVGAFSLTANTTNYENVAIGYGALFNADAADNTAVGWQSGIAITSGNNNSLFGSTTGGVTTGNQNIVIGASCNPPSATANGGMSIGNIIYGTGNTSTGGTVSAGKIGVGIKAPQARLHVQTDAAATVGVIVEGTGTATGDLIEWQDSSANVLSFVDATGWPAWSQGNKSVTTQFDATNTATLATVTGLSVSVLASGIYTFRAVLHVAADTVAGWKTAIAGTATATNVIWQTEAVSDTTNALAVSARDTTMGNSQSAAADANYFITIEGTIKVNAAGTLLVQFAQKTATPVTTSSVLVGSTFMVTRIS